MIFPLPYLSGMPYPTLLSAAYVYRAVFYHMFPHLRSIFRQAPPGNPEKQKTENPRYGNTIKLKQKQEKKKKKEPSLKQARFFFIQKIQKYFKNHPTKEKNVRVRGRESPEGDESAGANREEETREDKIIMFSSLQ